MRFVSFCMAIVMSFAGFALASGGAGIPAFGVTLGIIFGLLGTLTYFGGRSDFVARLGTVFILFVGGTLAFCDAARSPAFLMALVGGLVGGGMLCLFGLSALE